MCLTLLFASPQAEDCKEQLTAALEKYRRSNGGGDPAAQAAGQQISLSSLQSPDAKLLSRPLLRLRQACLHPQLGPFGLKKRRRSRRNQRGADGAGGNGAGGGRGFGGAGAAGGGGGRNGGAGSAAGGVAGRGRRRGVVGGVVGADGMMTMSEVLSSMVDDAKLKVGVILRFILREILRVMLRHEVILRVILRGI